MNDDTAEAKRPAMYLPALEYTAPFLIEKLMIEHIVETPEEGEALFAEVKRFIVLDRSYPEKHFLMYSNRIDEVWHQFILFTSPYVDFCNTYFGRYVHHAPSNSPKMPEQEAAPKSSFREFCDYYQTIFGEPLPAVWYDERCIGTCSRVVNDYDGRLTAKRAEDGMIRLYDDAGSCILAVSDLAFSAIAFIARTGSFFIRELPDELTDLEKVGLVSTLMEYHVLRVAP